jgi:hypothetical protein
MTDFGVGNGEPLVSITTGVSHFEYMCKLKKTCMIRSGQCEEINETLTLG